MAADAVNAKIGVEVHVPLRTERKLFCDCPTNYWETEEPNVNTCPVCTGMPGAKPFPLNGGAVEAAVMVAELLECEVARGNVFVKRKHYDYPDLPSGYQRTSEPFGVNGRLNGVGIWEVHLEEDPGRYDLKTGRVDYNRSGVPLIEIVTAPDMKSPEDVREFMRALVNMLKYTERTVEVGGVMRADVNISIEGGAKVEIKNINSVAGAFKAIQYEMVRQKNMMRRGAVVQQETRGYDEKTMVTKPQRLKETAADYRYIPDPDIPPQEFTEEYTSGIQLPETPQLRKKKLVEDYGVGEADAQTIVLDKDIADMFEDVSKRLNHLVAEGGVDFVNERGMQVILSVSRLVTRWICREVRGQLNYRNIELRESKLDADNFIELLELVYRGEITESTGKKILERVIDTGESPKELVRKDGSLKRISDKSELDRITYRELLDNPKAVVDSVGNPKALNHVMGKIRKSTSGSATPEVVRATLVHTVEECIAASSGALTPDFVTNFMKKKLEEL